MVSCCSVAEVTDSLQPHGLQRTRLPCPSLMVSRVLESLMGPRHMVPCHQDLLNIPSFLIQTGSRGKKKRKKANSRATNAVFHKCSVINCSFSSAKDRFFFPLLLFASFTLSLHANHPVIGVGINITIFTYHFYPTAGTFLYDKKR